MFRLQGFRVAHTEQTVLARIVLTPAHQAL
jgi:hypothetical protein